MFKHRINCFKHRLCAIKKKLIFWIVASSLGDIKINAPLVGTHQIFENPSISYFAINFSSLGDNKINGPLVCTCVRACERAYVCMSEWYACMYVCMYL